MECLLREEDRKGYSASMSEKERQIRHMNENNRKQREYERESEQKNLMVVCAGRKGGKGDVHCRRSACRERKKERGKARV